MDEAKVVIGLHMDEANYCFKLLTIEMKTNNEKQSILLCRIWVLNLKLMPLIGFLTKK